jgi:hypothetical protein
MNNLFSKIKERIPKNVTVIFMASLVVIGVAAALVLKHSVVTVLRIARYEEPFMGSRLVRVNFTGYESGLKRIEASTSINTPSLGIYINPISNVPSCGRIYFL